MPEIGVAELAAAIGGDVDGRGDLVITGANTLEQASATEIAFVEDEKAYGKVADSGAGCLVVPLSFPRTRPSTLIRIERPRMAFAKLLRLLYPEIERKDEVHPTALIAASARIAPNCSIGPYVTIGEDAFIAHGCVLHAGCRVGRGVTVGENSVLHPNVTLYAGVQLGSRVILHAGCVIGADGFGYTFAGDHFEKFPQVGTVVIEDDVELGANCCVDRAALGTTKIGAGTKLDNLIHIAHNCVVGRHVVIAAQTGLSGSVTVGDYAMIGGQTGVGEKATIDARSVVGGKAGILTSQHVQAGEPVWGIPARPLKQHLRGLAHVARLPKTEGEVEEIRKRLSALEQAAHEQT